MKDCKHLFLCLLMAFTSATAAAQYIPSADNLAARREFEECRFGIFIHWGIYSTFAQGEWYLNSGLTHEEYSKAASAFYPVRFDAQKWVQAIKDSGARYITFTSRHHDGFSMFQTDASDYDIVDATPYRRDVVGELAAACQQLGVRLHLYYSILDWMRTDYPLGRTGLRTGREMHEDYDSYFQFMKTQVGELLTHYPNVQGIWLDGYWDHDEDSVPFDWRMTEFYRYIHELKSSCLIGNNHHITPIEGEDFQMFERDLPGENKAGLSGQEISHLPLEMCQTMNGMWGYKVADQNYKSTEELIQLIARAAAKGSNLLLNIGPQPNGELPAAALQRLQGIGQWMKTNGESIYGTSATDWDEQKWGVTTQKEGRLFLHVLDPEVSNLQLNWNAKKPKAVRSLAGVNSEAEASTAGKKKNGAALQYVFDKKHKSLSITLPAQRDKADFVVEVVL
ncbi:MAG: alpha-L-fucosidase [Bacteroidaceae bacterium]|nr:alpha-L-fucosidase [Bacteroidaceae bacterium]